MSELHDKIIQLYEDGTSAKELAGKAGCSVPLVYVVARQNGLSFRKAVAANAVLPGKEKEIAEKLADGQSMKRIAEEYGVTRASVSKFCSKNGIDFPDTHYVNGRGYDDPEQHVRELIAEVMPSVEYVGGYTNTTGNVVLLCPECHTEVERTWQMTRKGYFFCQLCGYRLSPNNAEQKRLRKKLERESAKAAEREERFRELAARKAERDRLKAEEIERKRLARLHECPVCGTITGRKLYCSTACANKAENAKKEIKRRNKVAAVMIDTDITVHGLYKRDRGICYICGMTCQLDDYIVRDGTTICGDYYLSIDHVVPLAKGGKHSWSNVRLAHRICNSKKGDRIPPLPLTSS